MRGNYKWWDDLVGSLMPGHAATGNSPGLQRPGHRRGQGAPVHQAPPGSRWTRSDEWYNFSTNVRGNAHVLLTMDESTYDPGGNRMGYDHPISWCKPYDGGRAWVTGMGHFGAHFTEPALLAHIVGGVKWAAGVEPGDCGGTINSNFEKVALDENTERAVRARRRARRPRLLHRARARPDPRLRPEDPQRQDRDHARRLLGRRGRPDGHRA